MIEGAFGLPEGMVEIEAIGPRRSPSKAVQPVSFVVEQTAFAVRGGPGRHVPTDVGVFRGCFLIQPSGLAVSLADDGPGEEFPRRE